MQIRYKTTMGWKAGGIFKTLLIGGGASKAKTPDDGAPELFSALIPL